MDRRTFFIGAAAASATIAVPFSCETKAFTYIDTAWLVANADKDFAASLHHCLPQATIFLPGDDLGKDKYGTVFVVGSEHTPEYNMWGIRHSDLAWAHRELYPRTAELYSYQMYGDYVSRELARLPKGQSMSHAEHKLMCDAANIWARIRLN